MELAAWEKEKSVLINDGKRTAEEKQVALEQLQRRKPKKPLDQKRLVSDFTFEGLYKLFQAGVPSKVDQPMPYREDSNKQELQPPEMTLSDEAKQAWIAFYNQVEVETGPQKILEPVRGLANKAAEHATRIAGTVQLFENPAAVAVEVKAMQCGIQAMAWYLNEALRIGGASAGCGKGAALDS